jgi:hypothetical protein
VGELSDQEVLTRLFERVIKDGWRFPLGPDFLPINIIESTRGMTYSLWNHGDYEAWEEVAVEAIIYNHDFAKALWGDEYKWWRTSFAEESSYVEAWQHHLSEMVIADDLIQYLREWLGAQANG